MPIVLILGVATLTSTIFQSLSVNETTKIKLRVFSSQSAVVSFNKIVEDILLTPKLPFQLSGHVLRRLSDVFLFYDFTVSQFLESFKLCMHEHFSQGNEYSLCSSSFGNTKARIVELNGHDLQRIRELKSFRTYVESKLPDEPADVIALLEDDEHLRNELDLLTEQIYLYMLKFHCYLRVLLVLVKDLPTAPLGKNVRDLYMLCNARNNIVDSEAFGQCCRLLEGMAKTEMVDKILKCIQVIEDYQEMHCDSDDEDDMVSLHARYAFNETLEGFKAFVLKLEMDEVVLNTSVTSASDVLKNVKQRGDLKMVCIVV